jgi:5'-3' exonuclease
MKLNLIIDGNYLLNKNIFILFKDKSLYSSLEEILNVEFKKISNMYMFDNIYFVADSKLNWRKQIYPEYKETRKKNLEIDWEFCYKVFDEFKERLSTKPNVKVCNVNLAEGDDQITYITNESNKLGYSNFIVASDGDLYQLLKFDLNLNYINIMYNNKYSDEKIYLPLNYKVFLNHIESYNNIDSLFDDSDNSEYLSFLNKILNVYKISEKNTEECLFIKLVSGDNGDNIKSIYEGFTKTGKPRGIGETGAKTLYDLYKETYSDKIEFDSIKFKTQLSEILCFFKKVDKNEIDDVKKTTLDNIDKNLKLIVLNEKYIPDWLYNDMKLNINVI